jgi:hypothetical protein
MADRFLRFKVTQEQYERLEEGATACGLTLTAYCEQLLGLADHPLSDEVAALLEEADPPAKARKRSDKQPEGKPDGPTEVERQPARPAEE